MCTPPEPVFRSTIYVDNEPKDIPRTFDNVRRYCVTHDISSVRLEHIWTSLYELMRVPILNQQDLIENPDGGLMTILDFFERFGTAPYVVDLTTQDEIESSPDDPITMEQYQRDEFNIARALADESSDIWDYLVYLEDVDENPEDLSEMEDPDMDVPMTDEEETQLINEHYFGEDEQ